MDFASITKAVPGTFVPDMGTSIKLDETPNITAIPGAVGAAAAEGANSGGTFMDSLKSALDDVNTKLNTSDQMTRDLASGKTNDLNAVTTSVEESNLALSFTMAVRTKLMTAYDEVSRMQV
jgi:flagellar hook-basal body complex protein FliE